MVDKALGIRRKTLRQRKEAIWLAKLRRPRCFDEVVEKLVTGQCFSTSRLRQTR
jgi:hypothetical protein